MSSDQFIKRHIGPREHEIPLMLEKIGVSTIDTLIDQTIPQSIRLKEPVNLPVPLSENQFFKKIKHLASKNRIYRTYIGQGYYNTITPAVILRNVFENPGWYTSYTPYQAEVSQGRLEALLNFQTMIMDLTKMELANCSLLDEATSASEAMIMMYNLRTREMQKAGANVVFVDQNIFPQTLDVLHTRAVPLGIEIQIGNFQQFEFTDKIVGAIVQYPNAEGNVCDYSNFVKKAHEKNCLVSVIVDLLSLAMLTPPGEWDADIVVGSAQRFGVPMGYGGPHAGFLACRDKFKRNVPGRIIGVTKDVLGNNALRMALQTREQHIKREKATSNICTAQALLATMAGFYGIYHGQEGIRRIATTIHSLTGVLAEHLEKLSYKIENKNFFDTLRITLPAKMLPIDIRREALNYEINFRYISDNTIGISLDETTTIDDVNDIIKIFTKAVNKPVDLIKNLDSKVYFDSIFIRKSDYLTLDIFNRFHSETEMMRYIKKLENRDISLTRSMISLGSCTMKLNAAVEMLPVSWPEFGAIHPFVPADQAKGYHEMIADLEMFLIKITGLAGCTLQPNSGANGEYTGLLVIQAFHTSKGENHRKVVLIPASAHGTNPASAAMAGLEVVVVECDDKGNINIENLKKLAEQHQKNLSCFMVTYPSTHGVFESGIIEMCEIIHQNGGLVYMDGANMNAQVGLTSPGFIGADVCHLNLHKTFAIPHGGGGPGIGPICVSEPLVKFLPNHKVVRTSGKEGISAVAAAPWGSAGILPITYGYIVMLGTEGLTEATKIAILNANYLASQLQKHGFKILYTGETGRVGHEMILDCRMFKTEANISETDIAKRLMDYGFHAPTLSFPVHGTLMIEPTESESLQELDRFIEAMVSIKNEIEEIKQGKADPTDNVLKNAPHTLQVITGDEWNHKYNRQKAGFPLKWIGDNKFWPFVGRVDDAFGDRNLMCSCAPIDAYIKHIYQ